MDMKERLKKWQENTLIVESAELIRGTGRAIPSGCGGDMTDNRDQLAWNQEFRNNPIYRGFR